MTNEKKLHEATGGCLCQRVRYSARWQPETQLYCYCRACQYNTGGSHAAQFRIDEADLTIEGQLQVFDRNSDGGFHVTKAFCPICGTPVYTRSARFPEKLYVFAGTLDETELFQPDFEVFTDFAPNWARDNALHSDAD